MDVGRVAAVVFITLILVIGVNAFIYVSVKRKDGIGQIELTRQALRRARDPWKDEDSALEELSRLVTDLKGDHREEQGTAQEPETYHEP